MQVFIALILFYVGAAVGSFLSVVVYRLKTGKPGMFFGHSFCPHCTARLQAGDLIPLMSYPLLRGKCRACKKPISVHYFFLELFTAGLFLLLYLKFSFLTFPAADTFMAFEGTLFLMFLFSAAMTGLLMAIFFFDLLYAEIPDALSISGIIVAFVGNLLLGTIPVSSMVIGAVIGGLFFALQYFLSRGKWIGSGDIRLGVLMGVLLGWKMLLFALFFSYLLGALVSVYLVCAKRATMRSRVPFGPFLVLGTFLVIFFGQEIFDWYIKILGF